MVTINRTDLLAFQEPNRQRFGSFMAVDCPKCFVLDGSIERNRLGYMAQKSSLYGDLSIKQYLDFFAAETSHDVRQFNDLLADGHLKGIVVIPANFRKDLIGNKNVDIQIIVAGSEPNTAKLTSLVIARD